MTNLQYKFKVLGVLAIAAVSVLSAYPPDEKIKLGLDLKGGMQLMLQVETESVPEDSRSDILERVTEIIRNRIDEFGVQEPLVSGLGKDKIVIQLPGVTDRQRAIGIVGKAAHLEFKLASDNPELLRGARGGIIPDGYDYKRVETDGDQDKVLVRKDAVLTGTHLKDAAVGFDEYGQALVQLEFDSQGAKIFEKVTSRHVGTRLAIILDGKIHSAPVIREPIPNGKAQITGNFTDEEARDLALVLRAGSLPAPVKIIEERSIGASLGRESIAKSVTAALVGALLVFTFMPAYYLLAGIFANVGLIVYGAMVIGALSALSAVLTLPGIAGFILSIGMAVDANVLINERIREEKESGKSASSAVNTGYSRAFSAILDSNVTTLLSCAILFMFGTGPVKGFAVTLSIGILASMFSTLIVSRLMFDWLTHKYPRIHLKMFRLFGTPSIPFLRRRFWTYGFSALTLALGLVGFLGRGQENFGVEFVGGTLAQVRLQNTPDVAEIRQALEKETAKEVMIQPYGSATENQIVIRVADTDMHGIEAALRQVAGDQGYDVMRVERIGPTVSQDLRIKALWAVFLAMTGIFGYLAWRFDRIFAVAAVLALCHDVLFTLGVFALSGREISLPVVAAILTIMGYSVNDTIVTFDRVRDNLKLKPRADFRNVLEASINQTLNRTVLTSFSTLLCTVALYFFGGPAINDFAFTLLVGFTVGVYSTIFVAGALTVDFKAFLSAPRSYKLKKKTETKRKAAA